MKKINILAIGRLASNMTKGKLKSNMDVLAVKKNEKNSVMVIKDIQEILIPHSSKKLQILSYMFGICNGSN